MKYATCSATNFRSQQAICGLFALANIRVIQRDTEYPRCLNDYPTVDQLKERYSQLRIFSRTSSSHSICNDPSSGSTLLTHSTSPRAFQSSIKRRKNLRESPSVRPARPKQAIHSCSRLPPLDPFILFRYSLSHRPHIACRPKAKVWPYWSLLLALVETSLSFGSLLHRRRSQF